VLDKCISRSGDDMRSEDIKELNQWFGSNIKNAPLAPMELAFSDPHNNQPLRLFPTRIFIIFWWRARMSDDADVSGRGEKHIADEAIVQRVFLFCNTMGIFLIFSDILEFELDGARRFAGREL